jgi:hypothetical protein
VSGEAGGGRAASEVYGALEERLTAKAQRRTEYWTNTQVMNIGPGTGLPKFTTDGMICSTRTARRFVTNGSGPIHLSNQNFDHDY